jgi:hypothetical protein
MVDYADMRTQNILAEYAKIGVAKSTLDEFEDIWRGIICGKICLGADAMKSSKTRMEQIQLECVERFISKYRKDAVKFLERELGSTITRFEVVPKDVGDFQANIECVKGCNF